MILRKFGFLIFIFWQIQLNAQLVEVQANYNSIGDCEFVAYNNAKTPLFLNINFADLENTTFNEPLPYFKLIEPGFNRLFTLERDLDADVPRFNYEIKYYRSNPAGDVDLDFPYLLPFQPGKAIEVFEVPDIRGFWGREEPESWNATGFYAAPGSKVFAARNGRIVEITGAARGGDPQTWYHTWNNSITLLQPDGTLIVYHNVIDKSKSLKIGDVIYSGQELGEIASGATGIVLVIFKNSFISSDLVFIIPQFVTETGKTEIVLSSRKYTVVHPDDIRGREMTNKEKRKYLK